MSMSMSMISCFLLCCYFYFNDNANIAK